MSDRFTLGIEQEFQLVDCQTGDLRSSIDAILARGEPLLGEKIKTESKQAAEGWGGDRYEVYEDTRSGQVMLAQVSAWDTERDAQEFFNAYAKRTARRYAGATETDTVDSGAIARRAWRTSEGSVLMERRGSRVLVLEGVPENADAKSLAKSLWQ